MFTKHNYGMNHVWYVAYSFWYEFHTFVLTVQTCEKILIVKQYIDLAVSYVHT